MSWSTFIRTSKSPELPVVLLEDVGAEIGLVFALVGLTLAEITGNPRWDAVGSIAIGVLLVVIAIVLASEMKALLIGESASDADLDDDRIGAWPARRPRQLDHPPAHHAPRSRRPAAWRPRSTSTTH